jgi:integrase
MAKSTKICEWCNKQMARTNYYKHVNGNASNGHKPRCFMKKVNLMNSKTGEKVDQVRLKSLSIQNEMLTIFFKKIANEVMQLQSSIGELKQDPLIEINNLPVAEATKLLYKSTWSQFEKYSKKHALPLNAKSANAYIGQAKCAISTRITKRNTLQDLMRRIYGNDNLKLYPIRQKYSVKQKHSLSDVELEKYFKEQENLDHELYLAQRLMAVYGLRVSSVAALKKKHLDFIRTNFDSVTFPDTKTNSERTEKISKELMNKLSELTTDLRNEDFVFCQEVNDKSVNVRSAYLGGKINKALQKTNTFKKFPNKQYTSHIFRKTIANTTYQKVIEEAKDKAREKIGHKHSNNINFYIDK